MPGAVFYATVSAKRYLKDYRPLDMSPAEHQFADDAPKRDPWDDDELGFGRFSERLAEALVAQHAPTGYVVGLHGEWGAGKSTILNFVKAYLSKWRMEGRRSMKDLQYFDFDPWVVSGHQDLAAAFFKVLSEQIADRAERRSFLRRLTKGAVESGADKLVDAASKVGLIIDATGGTVATLGAGLTKKAIKEASEKWLSEPSLQKTYLELVERLKASGKRFIVFVDDLDRLSAQEIRSMMQMVKTVGRLPNVTYCLSYDRQIVWTALEDLAPSPAPRSGYAEKIVQSELEVPVPGRTGLMRMLEAALVDLPQPPTGVRQMEMLQAGLHRWIRHPRDVVRLTNAVHFALPALENEVDAWDMLCMEAMRLFDRRVFDWIRDNRSLLLGEGYRYPQEEKRAKEAAERLGASLEEGARADIIPILRTLFPNRSDAFGGRRGFASENWDDVVARRGIATAAGYSAYFSLAASQNAIPKHLVDEAVTGGIRLDRQLALIDEAIGLENEIGVSLVAEYFQELIHRIRSVPHQDLPILLEALIARSVTIFGIDEGARFLGPSSTHHILVGKILERLGPDLAGETLSSVFRSSEDVGALSAVYIDMARALGVIEVQGATRHEYITVEQLSELGKLLWTKIRSSTDEELTALPHYYEVARSWALLGDNDSARKWLAREARRSGHTLAKLSKGLLGTSTSAFGTSYKVYRDIDADLYDVDAIAEGCELHAAAIELTEDERLRIKALQEGLEVLRSRMPNVQEDGEPDN